MTDGLLHCPRGCADGVFGRVGDYTRHLLAHDLSQPEACRWLDWRAYDRLAAKRGWPSSEEMRPPAR